MGWLECLGIVLLFSLVVGMSATVDVSCLKHQIENGPALLTGVILQFMVLPFLGYLVVASIPLYRMDPATGIALLVVTSSPGGSFSNWWCSVFNADLALSITMTAISTLLSIVLMPLNLYIYCKFLYHNEDDVLETLHWGSLIFTLFIVLIAIGVGLTLSAFYRTPEFNVRMNQLGTYAGVALIAFSAVLATCVEDDDQKIWNQPAQFYIGTAMPCIFALFIATILVTFVVKLQKPERVTVAIEACYQNTAIATSVAINMFAGEAKAKAVAVPLFYGVVEAVILFIYCFAAWKAGWTKAPPDASVYAMLTTSYEVLQQEAALHKTDIDTEYHSYYDKTTTNPPPPTDEQTDRAEPGFLCSSLT